MDLPDELRFDIIKSVFSINGKAKAKSSSKGRGMQLQVPQYMNASGRWIYLQPPIVYLKLLELLEPEHLKMSKTGAMCLRTFWMTFYMAAHLTPGSRTPIPISRLTDDFFQQMQAEYRERVRQNGGQSKFGDNKPTKDQLEAFWGTGEGEKEWRDIQQNSFKPKETQELDTMQSLINLQMGSNKKSKGNDGNAINHFSMTQHEDENESQNATQIVSGSSSSGLNSATTDALERVLREAERRQSEADRRMEKQQEMINKLIEQNSRMLDVQQRMSLPPLTHGTETPAPLENGSGEKPTEKPNQTDKSENKQPKEDGDKFTVTNLFDGVSGDKSDEEDDKDE